MGGNYSKQMTKILPKTHAHCLIYFCQGSGDGVICGLSLLLVLVLALRVFSSVLRFFLPPQKPPFPNSNSDLESEGHRFMSRKTVKSGTLAKQLTIIHGNGGE